MVFEEGVKFKNTGENATAVEYLSSIVNPTPPTNTKKSEQTDDQTDEEGLLQTGEQTPSNTKRSEQTDDQIDVKGIDSKIDTIGTLSDSFVIDSTPASQLNKKFVQSSSDINNEEQSNPLQKKCGRYRLI